MQEREAKLEDVQMPPASGLEEHLCRGGGGVANLGAASVSEFSVGS